MEMVAMAVTGVQMERERVDTREVLLRAKKKRMTGHPGLRGAWRRSAVAKRSAMLSVLV